MPKQSRVTAESVFQAADAIASRGDRPTLRLVRAELGGGSFGTILPFLQTWQRSQPDPDAAPEPGQAPSLTPDVAAALDRLIVAAADVAEAVQTAGLRAAGPGETAVPAMGKPADDEKAATREEIEKLKIMAVNQIGQLRVERDDLLRLLTETRKELSDLKVWRERAVAHMKALGGRGFD